MSWCPWTASCSRSLVARQRRPDRRDRFACGRRGDASTPARRILAPGSSSAVDAAGDQHARRRAARDRARGAFPQAGALQTIDVQARRSVQVVLAVGPRPPPSHGCSTRPRVALQRVAPPSRRAVSLRDRAVGSARDVRRAAAGGPRRRLHQEPRRLDRLRRVETVLLDKTGTLTEGRPVAARWHGDDRGTAVRARPRGRSRRTPWLAAFRHLVGSVAEGRANGAGRGRDPRTWHRRPAGEP